MKVKVLRKTETRDEFWRYQEQRRVSYPWVILKDTVNEEVEAFNRMAKETLLEKEVDEERTSESKMQSSKMMCCRRRYLGKKPDEICVFQMRPTATSFLTNF